ncbi:MAG: PaaX family transcriptional regulator C-terminal domain-containing protein, partial [bacterium]|nr:PaaX family transcriptional regulator C-terminal domain-containing protein [bacterium]
KTGDLEKVTRGEETYLRLTARGYNAVHRDFPVLFLQNKPWDGKWRIVAFDIAEINHLLRQTLREKLKNLGFGMLQKSIWLTPHDIIADFRDFLEYHHLEDSVYAFETGDLLAGDEKELATKVWKLKKLNQTYESLLDEINMLQQPSIVISDRSKQLKAKVTNKMQRSRYNSKIKVLKNRYLKLFLSDPCLPKELLPDDWAGETVRGKIRELKSDKIN